MNETINEMRRQRDRRLRRRLLETLYSARAFAPSGWYGTRAMVDLLAAAGAAVEDEAHAMGLLTDLVNKGLIELRDTRTRKLQPYGLGCLDARIVARGSSLVEETEPPDADIEDERLPNA
ncbi:MAG: hypothetical protein IT447_16720 [Phycisphaerales bacterium]|nr:hypothetical protein [Phycisphaerales bacterium]